jgi:hypothetical protein
MSTKVLMGASTKASMGHWWCVNKVLTGASRKVLTVGINKIYGYIDKNMDKVLRGALKSIALAKCIDGSVKNH